jgi:hypothetical protein
VGELRTATLHAPDALRARALAPRSEPRGFTLPRPSWRLSFVVVPAALALAVGAALVHGLTKPSRNVATPLPATAFKTDAAPSSSRALAPAAGSGGGVASPAAGNGDRLAHTDASLTVRVPDQARLTQATDKATRIATSLGGYAQSVVYQNPAGGGGASYLELRIPAQNVKRAVAQLSALGTLVSQEISMQDLEHDLLVQSEQITQLRQRVAALQAALRSQALPEAQRVLLQIRLAEATRALEQRLSARQGTIAAGTTSRVSLVLRTADPAAVVPVQRGRLDRMLHSAVGFLALEAVVALYALVVVSPLVVAAALWWGLGRVRRRRDEQRLLMT